MFSFLILNMRAPGSGTGNRIRAADSGPGTESDRVAQSEEFNLQEARCGLLLVTSQNIQLHIHRETNNPESRKRRGNFDFTRGRDGASPFGNVIREV